MKTKLIYNDNCVPSIYFPAGRERDGGTCTYATDECLQGCPSHLVYNGAIQQVFDAFQKYSIEGLVTKILSELQAEGKKIIQWHAWGDCLPTMIEKEHYIMLRLKSEGITQFGFTRNRELWEAIPTSHNLRIGLSVDSGKEAVALSHRGLVCWPHFNYGQARLFFEGKFVARCSGWWCVRRGEEPVACNCEQCFLLNRGCFKEASHE